MSPTVLPCDTSGGPDFCRISIPNVNTSPLLVQCLLHFSSFADLRILLLFYSLSVLSLLYITYIGERARLYQMKIGNLCCLYIYLHST